MNKKERSLLPTPLEPGLFTVACENVRIITPRQLLPDSPQRASTATSVSNDRAGVLAVHSRLQLRRVPQAQTRAQNSHCRVALLAVPIQAERVPKDAALACATNYFEDDSEGGLAPLAGMLQP